MDSSDNSPAGHGGVKGSRQIILLLLSHTQNGLDLRQTMVERSRARFFERCGRHLGGRREPPQLRVHGIVTLILRHLLCQGAPVLGGQEQLEETCQQALANSRMDSHLMDSYL